MPLKPISYLHKFHAGNFADVFKHSVLAQILKIRAPEPPLFYLDTHAGPGLYDLFNGPAQRTQEHANGVKKLHVVAGAAESDSTQPLNFYSQDFEERKRIATYSASSAALLVLKKFSTNLDTFLEPYATSIVRANKLVGMWYGVMPKRSEGAVPATSLLRWYPGSPALAALLLSEKDSIYLYEAKKAERLMLEETMRSLSRSLLLVPPIKQTPSIRVSDDGLAGAKQFLGYSANAKLNGIVFVDPTYEQREGHAMSVKELLSYCIDKPRVTTLLWCPEKDTSLSPLDGLSLPSSTIHVQASMPAATGALSRFRLCILHPPPQLESILSKGLKELAVPMGMKTKLTTGDAPAMSSTSTKASEPNVKVFHPGVRLGDTAAAGDDSSQGHKMDARRDQQVEGGHSVQDGERNGGELGAQENERGGENRKRLWGRRPHYRAEFGGGWMASWRQRRLPQRFQWSMPHEKKENRTVRRRG